MKSVYKRILCFLLAMIMLPMCLLETAVPAQASYENTYVNTGDMRADIIGVAKTQVGYRESSSGRTKYGEWYGYPTIAWCAVFIGWCANQAGIPTSIIKKQGWANPSSFGWKSYPAKTRMPQPGDVFFRNTAHTGLVYYIEGDYFYTLEGNTWGDGDSTPRVMIRKRSLYDSRYTFASPAYEGESVTIPPDCDHTYEKGHDSAHPHKEYKKCTKCGHIYYTGLTVSLTSCQECKMANCSHNYGSWSKLDATYHQATCSKCGKVNKSSHKWANDQIIKEATCKDKGKKKQTCNDCSATREVDIPATNEHVYKDWQYINDEVHAQKCESCDEKTEKPHTTGDWNADTQNHWKTCKDCGGRVSIGAHKLTGDCGTACEVCGITPNSTHMYNSMWKQDDESHWQQCLNCTVEQNRQAHEFTADCDDTCDTCGYMRQAEHVYGKEWKSDATGHWLSCQICGQEKDKKAHAPGAEATEENAQLCNLCAYVVTPPLIHSHNYSYTSTDRTHTGVCVCGESEKTAGHVWDIQTGKCRICQADVPPVPQEMLFDMIPMPDVSKHPFEWMIASLSVAALILILILIIIIGSIVRKVKLAAAVRLQKELEEEDEDDDEDAPHRIEVGAIPIEAPDEPAEEPTQPAPLLVGDPDEEIDTEDILRRVAELEGLSYEESIGEAFEPAAEPAAEAVEPIEEAPAQEDADSEPQPV